MLFLAFRSSERCSLLVRLYENQSAPQGHWLEVALVQQSGANRNGIGGTVWRLPGAVSDLRLSGGMQTTIDWSAPADPGATAWSFDLLRATDPSTLSDASCLLTAKQLTSAGDSTDPGGLFCYLIRVNNACGGNSGVDSHGTPRAAASCP